MLSRDVVAPNARGVCIWIEGLRALYLSKENFDVQSQNVTINLLVAINLSFLREQEEICRIVLLKVYKVKDIPHAG